jgi:RNA polymerase sigma factor (sigma-70 family)
MTHQRDAILEGLIKNEWPKLRKFFRTKVPEGDVLDLVQNTMLAFVENGGPREAGNERAYLWGIARKQVLKHYEKHRRQSAALRERAAHGARPRPVAVEQARPIATELVAALHTLPADQQMAIELRHGEDLKLEEVAEALEVSLATAKRYLSAAEDKLRTELGGTEEIAEGYAKL